MIIEKLFTSPNVWRNDTERERVGRMNTLTCIKIETKYSMLLGKTIILPILYTNLYNKFIDELE